MSCNKCCKKYRSPCKERKVCDCVPQKCKKEDKFDKILTSDLCITQLLKAKKMILLNEEICPPDGRLGENKAYDDTLNFGIKGRGGKFSMGLVTEDGEESLAIVTHDNNEANTVVEFDKSGNIITDGIVVKDGGVISFENSYQTEAYTGAGSMAGTYENVSLTLDKNGKITNISSSYSSVQALSISEVLSTDNDCKDRSLNNLNSITFSESSEPNVFNLTVPTQDQGDNSNKVASTQYVDDSYSNIKVPTIYDTLVEDNSLRGESLDNVGNINMDDSSDINIRDARVTTQEQGDNSNNVASTEYVDSALNNLTLEDMLNKDANVNGESISGLGYLEMVESETINLVGAKVTTQEESDSSLKIANTEFVKTAIEKSISKDTILASDYQSTGVWSFSSLGTLYGKFFTWKFYTDSQQMSQNYSSSIPLTLSDSLDLNGYYCIATGTAVLQNFTVESTNYTTTCSGESEDYTIQASGSGYVFQVINSAGWTDSLVVSTTANTVDENDSTCPPTAEGNFICTTSFSGDSNIQNACTGYLVITVVDK